MPALRVDDLIAAVWGPQDGLAGPAEGTAGFGLRGRMVYSQSFRYMREG